MRLEHHYGWDECWARLPVGVATGYTHGIVEDASGRIFIFNTSKDAVLILDASGNYLGSWGAEFARGAHGMLLRREADVEYLYLMDHEIPCVVKATLDGREIWRLGTPPRPDLYGTDRPYKPTAVAVAPDGGVYVADGYGQSWIHRYSPCGEYLDSFGGLGSEAGRLHRPHGILLDTRGPEPLLLVADRRNARLQYFTLDGEPAGLVEGVLRFPCMGVLSEEELWIADLHSRITVLDRRNRLVAHLGDDPGAHQAAGWPEVAPRPGAFSSPHALHVDGRGNIYVVEWVSTGRIIKLRRET